MLITLGYQTLSDPIGKDVSIPNKHLVDIPNKYLVDIQRYQLHLTYVPIFDEVTTKYASNMGNRKGLNWEKKLNINDKLVSYKDNESILRNEMERKGNVKLAFNETHSNIASAIPVNSIINDNLYITTCNYFIRNDVVEVEYVVQENFILQNEDIRLPVSFERYNIPYEYVKREVYLENYLIFSKYQNFKYTNEIKSSNLDFIKYNLFSKNIDNNNKINKIMYGLVDIDNRSYLMRMAWVKSRFTMMIHGKFLDNYVAGIQRYSGIDDNPINRKLYSTPLSYTNGNGKFDLINSFQLGYNTSNELRLALENGDDYNLNLFPFGIIDGSKVNFNVNLINYQETIAINKDAGEQVSITLSNYLQNENEELKFYEFLEINKIGILNEDIFLNDDLLLSDINYSDYEYSFDYIIEEFVYNSFRVKILNVDVSEFDKGIVLLNETNNVTSLVGIVKTPTVIENYLEFYIYTSRNGFYQKD
ncbi:MAG TPA: hypothetical protein VJ845_02245, partial [Haploplasma sp.]|nr:hypothetical protein [Haploplasma sp.]